MTGAESRLVYSLLTPPATMAIAPARPSVRRALSTRLLEAAWRLCLLTLSFAAFLLTIRTLYAAVMTLIDANYTQLPGHVVVAVLLTVLTTTLWAYRDEIVAS